jgi:two-component system response regulator MtrA
MTHFLFLEKGAQLRDAQRAKSGRDGSASRSRRRDDAAASAPAVLFLMVPTGDGYRVMRASLEDVVDIPASELARYEAGQSPALLLERLFGSGSPSDRVGRLEPTPGFGGTAAPRGGARPSREAFGVIEIDVPARVVTRDGEVVALAPMEFDLLLALTRRNGAAASRRELLREVWGTTKAISLRTVDTHVANLRRKIETSAASPKHILTVKKVGYRLKR